MNSNFCVMPWIHVHTYPNGGATPCCMWDLKDPVGNINSATIQDIAHSDRMNQIRSSMLQNNEVAGCFQCNEKANSNVQKINFRKRYNEEFSYLTTSLIENTNADGGLKNKFETKFMNIRYSNLCNYACRTCGPIHSSLWAQENNDSNPVKKIIDIKPDYMADIFEQLKTADSINFAGGESLLIPQHWEVLDELIRLGRTHVRIRYVTNLSKLTYQNKNILDYAKQFPNFVFMLSIDASHERAELHRHGTVWEQVEQNLKLIKESGVGFFINCTVGAANVWHAPDLHRYLAESMMITDNFSINLLVDSKMMSTKILPIHFKRTVAQKILKHILWLESKSYSTGKWNDIILFMLSEDHSYLLSDFILYNKTLDKKRNQSLIDVFPELKDALVGY